MIFSTLLMIFAINPPAGYEVVDSLSFEASLEANGNRQSSQKAFGRQWTLKMIPYPAGLAQINLESEANQLIQIQINTKKGKKFPGEQGEHWDGESLYLAEMQLNRNGNGILARVQINWLLPSTLVEQRKTLLELLEEEDYQGQKPKLERLTQVLPADPQLNQIQELFEKHFQFSKNSFPIRITGAEGFQLNFKVPSGLRNVRLNGVQLTPEAEGENYHLSVPPDARIPGPAILEFEDNNGHRLERRIHIVPDRQQWAVLIYQEYQNSPNYGALTTAVDKDAWLGFLKSVSGLEDERILVVGNRSWKDTASEISKFLKNSKRDDLVLVFFAGHGARIARTDSTAYDLVFAEERIDINNVFRHFNDVSPGNHLFIFDSCFSGASWESGSNYASSVETLPIMNRAMLVAGASWFQYAGDAEGGIFTRTFLHELQQLETISVGKILDRYQENGHIEGENQNISIRNQLPPSMLLFRRNRL